VKRPTSMNRIVLAALATLAVGAAGCNRAAAPPGAPSAAANAARVELHADHGALASDHEQVGLVQAFGTGDHATHADVLQALREQGARMGCDAVVRVSVHVGVKNAHAIGVCARRSAEERTADARD
jgi:hypothetical protein